MQTSRRRSAPATGERARYPPRWSELVRVLARAGMRDERFIHTRYLRSVVCLHAKQITGDGQIRAIHDVLTVDAAGALRRLHAVLDQLL